MKWIMNRSGDWLPECIEHSKGVFLRQQNGANNQAAVPKCCLFLQRAIGTWTTIGAKVQFRKINKIILRKLEDLASPELLIACYKKKVHNKKDHIAIFYRIGLPLFFIYKHSMLQCNRQKRAKKTVYFTKLWLSTRVIQY